MSAAPTAKEMNELLRWIGETPESGESNFDELCRAVAVRKNKEHALRFAAVPFARRIVLVPQCLRKLGACKAKETARGYECAGCMACPAGRIHREASRLGYRGVFMLKGGRAIAGLIAREMLEDILGKELPSFPDDFDQDTPFSLSMAEAVKNQADPAEPGQQVTALKTAMAASGLQGQALLDVLLSTSVALEERWRKGASDTEHEHDPDEG